MSEQQEKKTLPRWLVLVVVLATGGITTAAMFATGLRGPSMAWDRASKGVESVWAGDPQAGGPMPVGAAPMAMGGAQAMPQPASAAPLPQGAQPGMPMPVQPMAPSNVPAGMAYAAAAGPVMPVAAQPGVPTILWGTPIGHGDRGPCTNCHGVVMPQGMPVPAISALSVMPHAYRGVCNNCHEVRVMPLGAPVAGVITVPPMDAMAGAPPKRAPTEAEWMGLEVGVAPQGVLVNGVEATAKRAGMRVGDLISSINGIPITTVADFVAVTQNGKLAQGAVIARREGQRLAFELARGGQPPQAMQMPMQMQMQMQGQDQAMRAQQGMPMQGVQREDQQGMMRGQPGMVMQNPQTLGMNNNEDRQGMRGQLAMPMQGMPMPGMQMPGGQVEDNRQLLRNQGVVQPEDGRLPQLQGVPMQPMMAPQQAPGTPF
jgi:hypothetical protein